eukprot:scaffold1041_cov124-Isochrysis_galbana.AAC.10
MANMLDSISALPLPGYRLVAGRAGRWLRRHSFEAEETRRVGRRSCGAGWTRCRRRMLRRRRGRKGGWSSVDEAGGCGIGWRAKRGVGRVTSKGATLASTRTRSHVWALDQVGPRPSSGVGECLVGRHVSGVAVDRCALFGAVRAGSRERLAPGLLCRRSVGRS